jgi:arabinose-5-phosphate isomerase
MSDVFQETAARVLRLESAAVADLATRVDETFSAACRLILETPGRVVVTGMGKSGHIGRKLAATLASTGTPAFFVHPGEASHGDLGMITSGDVVLALSNSGETAEVLAILPVIKRRGIRLIAMTGRDGSSLARQADVHLYAGVKEEACPLNLAPTSSTTAALALGDALAIALLDAHGFTEEDFALSHPGGSLGKRLLLKVDDLMHIGKELPCVKTTDSIASALLEMTAKGLGMTAVVDASGVLVGIFTDGDLRRMLMQEVNVREQPITSVMTRNPVTLQQGQLAAAALQLMESRKINGLIVVDENARPLGAINMHDLLRAGVV